MSKLTRKKRAPFLIYAKRGESPYKILILKLLSSVINFNPMIHRTECMH